MKLLLLNANRAGIGTYHRALNFGRQLAAHGHDVTLMTVSNQRRFVAQSRRESAGMRVVECPNWLDELLPWHASGVLDILLRVREIRSGDYDVVYAFEYQPNISIPVFLTRRFCRYTLLSDWCDWHAGAAYHFGGHRWAHAIDRFFEERIRHQADFVTTINQTLHTRARDIGVPAERVAVVGEGVDPAYVAPLDRTTARRRLQLDDRAPLVATIRDSVAAAELLCAAVAEMTARDAKLLFIGTPPAELQRAAKRHGITHRLIAPGRVSDEELPWYLAAADMFALPLEDNLVNRGRWPHKLGDMLAAQRPVVVSLGGEFPTLLRQKECAVIADFDARSFAAALDEIVRTPANYEPVAARARALVEHELDWRLIGNRLESVLNQATRA
jgi:glycosyltransferase involved in cell wall biosynthesis